MATENIEALHERASRLLQGGEIGEAIDAHEKLLAAAPDLADSWFNLAFLQRRSGRHAEALESYQRALDCGIAGPEEVHLNRGVIYADNLAMGAEAEEEFRLALAINPDCASAALNLGNVLEDRGEREQAREAYERTLSIEPGNAQALGRLISIAEISSADDTVISRARNAIAAAHSPLDRADLGFALGKALDGVGAYDEAFAAYAAANLANSEAQPGGRVTYEPAQQERFIDRLIKAFPVPVVEETEGDEQRPIFICGMFRSGSTLVERILGAHSAVTEGGELPLVPALVRNGPQPYPEAAAAASAARIAELRAGYFEGLRSLHPDGRVTDKRPDNFLHIGLIKRLFPDAKIINTVRNPIDNCLSVWFLHLNPSVVYSHELNTIVHWYRQYRRLMDHWRGLYPDDILDMDYDALVADPRPATERLLGFCELDWEDTVLAFHETEGRVRTASAWQVRQPLYTKSSGRWRNYEAHIAPLIEAFGTDSAAEG